MRDLSMAQGKIQSRSWESSARQKLQRSHWPRDNFKFSRPSTLLDGQTGLRIVEHGYVSITRSAIRFKFLQDQEFQSRSDKLQQCSSTILGSLELRCRQSMRPRVVWRCTCAYLLTSYRWQANVAEILSE